MSQLKYYENGSWLGITPPELVTISATEPQDEHSHAILWVDTATSGIIPADYGVMDNLTTTVSGQYVLDAHQGKILKDLLDSKQDSLILGQGIDINSNNVISAMVGTNTTDLLLSGSIAASGSLSYTAPKNCVCYLSLMAQANSNLIFTIKINSATIYSITSGEAISTQILFFPVYLQKGDLLSLTSSNNKISSYYIYSLN